MSIHLDYEPKPLPYPPKPRPGLPLLDYQPKPMPSVRGWRWWPFFILMLVLFPLFFAGNEKRSAEWSRMVWGD